MRRGILGGIVAALLLVGCGGQRTPPPTAPAVLATEAPSATVQPTEAPSAIPESTIAPTEAPPAPTATKAVVPTKAPAPKPQPTAAPAPAQTNYDRNGDGKVTCADFDTQAQAKKALGDGYTKLDQDGDGVPCETLPPG